jgi:Domain of unknown function (DUF4112)
MDIWRECVRQAEPATKPIILRPLSQWPEPGHPLADETQRLRRLRAVVRLLDSAFEIPGTRFRIGLDAIVGLVPGLGDLVTTAASVWILNEARLLGVTRRTRIRMGWNIAIDFLVGAVPLAGDFFDAAWRANVKNLALIERDLSRRSGRETARSLRSSAPLMPLVSEPGPDGWPTESDTLAQERPTRGGARMKPTIATAAIVAICAAIASFMSGAFWGLILAIVAVVAGGLGMLIAVSPRRRGGILSLASIGLGVIALVKAVLVAVF